ncbi:hypothetical protein [Devosia ginsengisoli]|uniref:Uncharacterized protein n=1 Tax=Devosia ginsengisoli TaxID=400770 RepID=A0A5B8LN01_9HYPH|nr:hypothetical protein [Devosia ginsengisoli]QDZ09628.1 hypothetical protein FPZ08_02005 [Devosia ginsengisoli]
MTRPIRSILRAIAAVRFATLEIKFDLLLRALERRYRPDQPRAPKGTPDGGQWIDDLFSASQQALAATERVRVAAGPKCDGFSSGCQLGGSFGTTGMYRIFGKTLCRSCALKILGIENLPHIEQQETLGRFDSMGQK